MKPFKTTLTLSSEASPHLYVRQIKELMNEDGYLHPMLKTLLQALKKARMPYVRLSLEKEIVIAPELHCHFERAIKPEAKAWGKIDWTEEEIKECDEDPKQYVKNVLQMQKSIGYDFSQSEEQSEEDIEELIRLTKPKKKRKGMFRR